MVACLGVGKPVRARVWRVRDLSLEIFLASSEVLMPKLFSVIR